jgi:hypothetical protein
LPAGRACSVMTRGALLIMAALLALDRIRAPPSGRLTASHHPSERGRRDLRGRSASLGHGRDLYWDTKSAIAGATMLACSSRNTAPAYDMQLCRLDLVAERRKVVAPVGFLTCVITLLPSVSSRANPKIERGTYPALWLAFRPGRLIDVGNAEDD